MDLTLELNNKTTDKIEASVKKKIFKDASTQTRKYVEILPPPINIDTDSDSNSNSEDESNEVPYGDIHCVDSVDFEDHIGGNMLDKVKLEIDEFIRFKDDPNYLPVQQNPIDDNADASFKSNRTTKKQTTAKTKPKPQQRERNKDQRINCQLCSFTCKWPSDLKRHMLMHTGEKPHKCEFCEKRFAQKTDLNRHIIIHTVHYEYHCSSCGRGFPDDPSTKQHEQKCNIKRYDCDLCNYKTFSKGNLQLHKRTHTGERPYSCESCGKQFARVGHFNKHVKLHANEFQLHCTKCGRGFAELTEQLAHEINCKNRILQCYLCGELHYRMDNLRRHINMLHLGEKSILCEFCSKQFPSKSGLNKHIKSIHSGRPEKKKPFVLKVKSCRRNRKNKETLAEQIVNMEIILASTTN